jgi:hypothetical protein
MRSARLAVALALLVAAAPTLAYTIYLKDGSRIVARDKYEVEGDLAIITLPSGTKSSIPVTEIDVRRTEKANESRLGGTAVVIEGGEARELKATAPPPPKPKLQDLIRANEGELRGLDDVPAAAAPSDAPATPAATLRQRESTEKSRQPYPDTQLAADVLQTLASRGVTAVRVHASGDARRPLLVFETNTESAVFKAIVASANTLLQLGAKQPGTVEGFELVCESAGGQSGGRFDLTAKLAEEIVSRRYEITRFYVENVKF